MPEQDARIELLKRGFELFNRGELEQLLQLFDPDAEVIPAILPMMGRGPIRGTEEMRQFWGVELPQFLPEFHVESLAFEAVGDALISHARYHARGAASGIEIDQVFHSVFRFREGRVVSLVDYTDEDEARAAART